jgi:hypothetical protein
VFLRVLDYYTGILFLTTNRPGTLDEAFKSRIHYKIYYPPLTRDQTIDIWKLNIQRLRQITEQSKEKRPLEIHDTRILHFADRQFDEGIRFNAGQWNGRQIRNAFQVARSLAYYDAVTDADQITELGPNDPARPAVLEVKYFEMMHEITESFDHYMLEVFKGSTDKDLALEMEHRADNFSSNRAYRSEPREEPDDRYGAFNGRTLLDLGSRQDSNGRPKSTSYRGSRPSLSWPGPSHRYSPNPRAPALVASYGDPGVDDKTSSLLQPGDGPPDFRKPPAFDNDHGLQGSSTGSRFGPSFGGSEFRGFGRSSGSYGAGRDLRDQNDFDANQGYRMERNEYNKRERS